MSTDRPEGLATAALWSPSSSLSDRVRRLREEFFSFYSRDHFRNEVRPYTSGTSWDEVWSPYHWASCRRCTSSSTASATACWPPPRPPPAAEFWKEPLAVRRASSSPGDRAPPAGEDPRRRAHRRLLLQHGPLQDPHPRRGAQVASTGGSLAQKAEMLNQLGVGNCGAVPATSYPTTQGAPLGFRHRRRAGGDAAHGEGPH